MRGITPVVAVILLLLVTISIVGFAMIFFQRTAEQASAGTETQLQQLGTAAERFEIVNIDKNKVYVKNAGTSALTSLKFYVDGSEVSAGAVSIPSGTVGEAALDSAQLAQLPGDRIKVTSAGSQDEVEAKFYAKNTVAYWRFDDGERAAIKDYSGNGNHGTFNGETWNDGTISGSTQAGGKYGNAMSFDGSDDYVSVGSLGIPQNGQATIEGWFYFKDFARERGRHMSLFRGLLYQHSANNELYFAGNDLFLTAAILELNKWHHIALTYSGDASTAALYIDSRPVQRQIQGAPDTISAFPGLISDNSPNSFYGFIDEVRIYNRALTPQEIIDDMNSPYPIARTVASYSFEKIVSNQVQDTHNIVKGKYGAAMSFDGVNDYIDAGNVKTLKPSGPVTVMAWFKHSDTVYHIFSNWWASGWRGINLGVRSGTLRFSIGSTGGNPATGDSVDSGSLYKDDQWHHVAGLYDQTNLRLKIFIDGVVKEDKSTAITAIDYETDLTESVAIGAVNVESGASEFLSGHLDEVRILNVAMS